MIYRYDAEELGKLATALFVSSGLSAERSEVVARILLEADLLGFKTHGLKRLPTNLEWIDTGRTRRDGDLIVLRDSGSILSWDASFLPGPWVVYKTISIGCERVADHGIVTATIRRSQHVAALASYLRQATERGYMILIVASTPSERTVCAHNGTSPVFSPNPIAVGIPTEKDPILIDISMSMVAEGQVTRARDLGERLASRCIRTTSGQLSDEPADFYAEPRGTILPIGGADHGYKGYALSILTEALTAGLGGYGRVDNSASDGEANAVFLQIIDPNAFGAKDRFLREMSSLAVDCRASASVPGGPPVRVPGDRALELRRTQLATGVELHSKILEGIAPWAEKYGLPLPAPLP